MPEAFKNCVDAFGGNYLTYKNIWDSYIENNSIVSSNNKRGYESLKLMHEDVFELDDDILQKFFEFTWDYNVFNNTGFSKPLSVFF